MSCPLIINGWTICAHPLFLGQLDELIKEVECLRKKACKRGDPDAYLKKNASKRLAAIKKLILEEIPGDPSHRKFLQGLTLGPAYRSWRRVKFFQQYRLFFRFHSESGIIIPAWVNDETCKRAYGAKSDAYGIFEGMLRQRHPPSDWDDLAAEARREWCPDQEMG